MKFKIVSYHLTCYWKKYINHPFSLFLFSFLLKQLVGFNEQWDFLPYLWFACHWLAMSHSCYNPIIYCYMNARFRSGFIQVLHQVPGLRRCGCLKRCGGRPRSGSNATNLVNTGEKTDPAVLRRKNRIRIRCQPCKKCI